MTATNTQLALDYLEIIWNQGKTDLADSYLAEDLIQHNPDLPDGRKALVEFIDSTRGQLPQARFDIRRTAEQGDLVFVHSLFQPQEDVRGLAVIDVFRVKDGVIVEHWDLNEAVPETTVGGREIV